MIWKTLRPGAWLCVILLSVACRDGQAADDAGAQPKVDSTHVVLPAGSPQLKTLVITPARAAVPDSVRIPGRVVWNEDVTVRVFSPFAGRVVKVLADIGRPVREGDTLALIAAPDFGQAQADARRAATDLAQAERNAARMSDLLQHGVVAKKDLESADADLARARAEAQRAQARVAQYGNDASSINQEFALRAPVAGTIVDRTISAGQEVRPDQMLANAPQLFAPLFVITDPARMWVVLDIPERDAGVMRTGTQILLRPEAMPSRTVAGTISVVSSAVDPNTRTVKARAVVPNADGFLRDEMMVSVGSVRPSSAAIEVPTSAVLLDGSRHIVFVADGANQFRRQPVEIGPEHGGWVPVTRGLSPADRVVSDGALFVEQFFHK